MSENGKDSSKGRSLIDGMSSMKDSTATQSRGASLISGLGDYQPPSFEDDRDDEYSMVSKVWNNAFTRGVAQGVTQNIPAAFNADQVLGHMDAIKELESNQSDFEGKVQKYNLKDMDRRPMDFLSNLVASAELALGTSDIARQSVVAHRAYYKDAIAYHKGEALRKMNKALELNEKILESTPEGGMFGSAEGFANALGTQVPNMALSVLMPASGTYILEHGDLYIDNLRTVASEKMGIDEGEVSAEHILSMIDTPEGDAALEDSKLSAMSMASLDLIGVGAIAKTTTPVVKEIVKKGLKEGSIEAAKRVLPDMFVEGVTEGIQGQVGIASRDRISGEDYQFDWDQFLEEFAAGAVIGGVFSGTGDAIAQGRNNRIQAKQKTMAERKKEVTTQIASNSLDLDLNNESFLLNDPDQAQRREDQGGVLWGFYKGEEGVEIIKKVDRKDGDKGNVTKYQVMFSDGEIREVDSQEITSTMPLETEQLSDVVNNRVKMKEAVETTRAAMIANQREKATEQINQTLSDGAIQSEQGPIIIEAMVGDVPVFVKGQSADGKGIYVQDQQSGKTQLVNTVEVKDMQDPVTIEQKTEAILQQQGLAYVPNPMSPPSRGDMLQHPILGEGPNHWLQSSRRSGHS